ncbi:unnamed protein product [Hymenolepis diminuta]|uniref:Uncharacterized protein n=1 Tax=Hymenolepis diminuta TaxID=6216 RepID=A0A564YUT5_HYMDI|nr:unnamed protein product [Hymenolepis diminuta]
MCSQLPTESSSINYRQNYLGYVQSSENAEGITCRGLIAETELTAKVISH